MSRKTRSACASPCPTAVRCCHDCAAADGPLAVLGFRGNGRNLAVVNSEQWDQRYAGEELVWSAGPNIFVAGICRLAPGRVLDLAAGEGRNALWLAERGWQVTAVDFSQVAVDRMRSLAAARLGQRQASFKAERANLLSWSPPAGAFDLVLLVYLQVPAERAGMSCRPPRGLSHRVVGWSWLRITPTI